MRNLPTVGATTAHGAAINAYPAHHQGVGVEVGKYAQIASPHDWPLLERAVEQAEFVQWWRDRVKNGRPKTNPDLDYFSADKATELTGITQPQVSKWAKRLKDEGKYRATLFGAATARRLISCGQRLKEKRDALPHGQWLPALTRQEAA